MKVGPQPCPFASREGLGGGGEGETPVHLQAVKGGRGGQGGEGGGRGGGGEEGGGGRGGGRGGFRGVFPIMGFRVIIHTLASSSAMIAWRPFRNVLAGSAALAEPAWSR